jgi:hypothetical protein
MRDQAPASTLVIRLLGFQAAKLATKASSKGALDLHFVFSLGKCRAG